jgi:DNA-binding PadR family transcriptional regulator
MADRRGAPDPATFLPLTHLSYFLLLVLADGPGHGYGLVQRIRERSADLVNPGTGSFYSILQKTVEAGLVVEQKPQAGNGARGRTYALRPLGRRVLAAEAARLETLAADTRRKLMRPAPQGGSR